MNEDSPIPLKLFCKKYEWPTLQELRMMRHKQEILGISEAFIKFGGKVLIKPVTFFKLLENAQKLANTDETNGKCATVNLT